MIFKKQYKSTLVIELKYKVGISLSNKINLLDCTLRDGGYYNNWFFKRDLINEYLRVMDLLKIDYVEIGFRFLDKVKIKGPWCIFRKVFKNS